jgi:hypothetical protein
MRGTSGTLIVEQRTVFAPGFRSWQEVEASYNIKGIVSRDFYGQKTQIKGYNFKDTFRWIFLSIRQIFIYFFGCML